MTSTPQHDMEPSLIFSLLLQSQCPRRIAGDGAGIQPAASWIETFGPRGKGPLPEMIPIASTASQCSCAAAVPLSLASRGAWGALF